MSDVFSKFNDVLKKSNINKGFSNKDKTLSIDINKMKRPFEVDDEVIERKQKIEEEKRRQQMEAYARRYHTVETKDINENKPETFEYESKYESPDRLSKRDGMGESRNVREDVFRNRATEKNESAFYNAVNESMANLTMDKDKVFQRIQPDKVNQEIQDLSMRLESTNQQGRFAIDDDFKKSSVQNYITDVMGDIGYYEFNFGKTEATEKSKEMVKNFINQYNDRLDYQEDQSIGSKFLTGAYNMFDPYVDASVRGKNTILASGLSGGIKGAIATATTPIVGDEILGASGGFLAGAGAGFRFELAKEFYKRGAGNAYLEMVDQGIREEYAKPFAMLSGVAEGVLEQAQFDLMSKSGKAIVETSVKAFMEKQLGSKAMKKLALEFGKNWISEALEEGTQAFATGTVSKVSQSVENMSRETENKDLIDVDSWKEIGKTFVSESYNSLYATWAFPFLGGAMQTPGYLLNSKKINSDVEAVSKSADAAYKNQDDIDVSDSSLLIQGRKVIDKIKSSEFINNKNRSILEDAQSKLDEILTNKKVKAQENVNEGLNFRSESESEIEDVMLNVDSVDDLDLSNTNDPINNKNLEDYKLADKKGIKNNILQGLKEGKSQLELAKEFVKDAGFGKSDLASSLALVKSVEKVNNEIETKSLMNTYENVRKSQEIIDQIDETAETQEIDQESISEGETDGEQVNVQEQENIEQNQNLEAEQEDPEVNEVQQKVQELNVNDIEIDAERFQFRTQTDNNGVTKKLDSVDYNENLAGIITVWQDEFGDKYVVNGHHRLDLAKKSTTETITSKVITSDEYTAEEAKGLGAMINIAEGNASAIDIAKLFRTNSIDEEKLAKFNIPMNQTRVKDALKLKNLHEFLFTQVATKQMSLKRGALIGELIPDSQSNQIEAYKMIKNEEAKGKRLTLPIIESMIKTLTAADVVEEEQMTLFGAEKVKRTLAYEKAEIQEYIKNKLNKEKRLLSKLDQQQNVELLEQIGNKIDMESNVSQLNQAEQILMALDKMANYKGTVINELLNKYAKALDAGEKGVKQQAYEDIIDLYKKGEIFSEYKGDSQQQSAKDTSGDVEKGRSETEGQLGFMDSLQVVNEKRATQQQTYQEMKDIIEASKKNPYLNGVNVKFFDREETLYFETGKEAIDNGYPKQYAGQKLKVTGEQKILDNGESEILLYKGSTKDTISEELVHTLQDRLQLIDNDLYSDIQLWEENIKEQAQELDISIPSGKELFAQAFIFGEMGYAMENPQVANLIAIDNDIVDRFTNILGDDLLEAILGDVPAQVAKEKRTLKSMDQTFPEAIMNLMKGENRQVNQENLKNNIINTIEKGSGSFVGTDGLSKLIYKDQTGKYNIETFDKDGEKSVETFNDSNEIADNLINTGHTYSEEMFKEHAKKIVNRQLKYIKDEILAEAEEYGYSQDYKDYVDLREPVIRQALFKIVEDNLDASKALETINRFQDESNGDYEVKYFDAFENLLLNEQFTLEGINVKNPYELSLLLSIFNNTAFESSGFIFIKDGVIDNSAIFTNKLWGQVEIPDEIAQNALQYVKDNDIDTVYDFHNHPVGSVKPSDADYRASEKFHKYFDGVADYKSIIIGRGMGYNTLLSQLNVDNGTRNYFQSEMTPPNFGDFETILSYYRAMKESGNLEQFIEIAENYSDKINVDSLDKLAYNMEKKDFFELFKLQEAMSMTYYEADYPYDHFEEYLSEKMMTLDNSNEVSEKTEQIYKSGTYKEQLFNLLDFDVDVDAYKTSMLGFSSARAATINTTGLQRRKVFEAGTASSVHTEISEAMGRVKPGTAILMYMAGSTLKGVEEVKYDREETLFNIIRENRKMYQASRTIVETDNDRHLDKDFIEYYRDEVRRKPHGVINFVNQRSTDRYKKFLTYPEDNFSRFFGGTGKQYNLQNYSMLKTMQKHDIEEGYTKFYFNALKPLESPLFREWFGDSIIKENGRPMRLYHGTDVFGGFDVFNKDKQGKGKYGKGFYFTTDYDYAAKLRGDSGTVMEVYMKMENPLDLNKLQMKDRRVLGELVEEEVFKDWLLNKDNFIHPQVLGMLIRQNDIDVQSLGYDGVIAENEYVVFNPTQVKATEQVTGEFNPENPNINYQVKPIKPEAWGQDDMFELADAELNEKTAAWNKYQEEFESYVDAIYKSDNVFKIEHDTKTDDYAIVHPYTKDNEYLYQISYFDEDGAWGDYYTDDFSKVVDELFKVGYKDVNNIVIKPVSRQIKTKSLGLHYGDLGTGRDTLRKNMTYGRSTGHMGTGTYFLGENAREVRDKNSITSRPVKTIDLDQYNLLKIRDDEVGWDIHDTFRSANRLTRMFSSEELQILKNEELLKDTIDDGLTPIFIHSRIMQQIDKQIQEIEDLTWEIEDEQRLFEIDEQIQDLENEKTRWDELRSMLDNSRFLHMELKEYGNQIGVYFDLVDSIIEVAKDFENDTDRQITVGNSFLQKYGYDGVDVRDTTLDSTTYGSVIFSDEKGNPIVEAYDDSVESNIEKLKEITKKQQEEQKLIKNYDDLSKKSFQMKPVDGMPELYATHNLTLDNLQNSIELGGFPVPSIAVASDQYEAQQFVSGFGNIVLIFKGPSIDPQLDENNMIFYDDAFTTTFPDIKKQKVMDIQNLKNMYEQFEKYDLDGQLKQFLELIKTEGFVRDYNTNSFDLMATDLPIAIAFKYAVENDIDLNLSKEQKEAIKSQNIGVLFTNFIEHFNISPFDLMRSNRNNKELMQDIKLYQDMERENLPIDEMIEKVRNLEEKNLTLKDTFDGFADYLDYRDRLIPNKSVLQAMMKAAEKYNEIYNDKTYIDMVTEIRKNENPNDETLDVYYSLLNGLLYQKFTLKDVQEFNKKEILMDIFNRDVRKAQDYINDTFDAFTTEKEQINVLGFQDVDSIIIKDTEYSMLPEQNKKFLEENDINIINRGTETMNMVNKIKESKASFQLKIPHINFTQSEEMDQLSFPETVENAEISDDLKTLLNQKEYNYAVKKNINTYLSALKYLDEVGVDEATEAVIDPSNSGTPELFALAQAIIAYRMDEGETREAERLIEIVSVKSKNLGQAIQVLSMWGRYTPEGITRYAKRVIRGSMTERDVENVKNETRLITNKMNKINRDTVDQVDFKPALDEIKNIDDAEMQWRKFVKEWNRIENQKKGTDATTDLTKGKTTEEATEDTEMTAEELLARKVVNTTNKPKARKEKSALEIMVDTLFNVAKESPLPDKKNAPVDNKIELIADAIKNRSEYRQVWDRAKVIVKRELEANDRELEMKELDAYFDKAINRTFPDNKLDKVIRQKMNELDIELRKVVKKHYTVNNNVRRRLMDAIIQETDLNEVEAAILEKHIYRQMKDKTKAAKESILKTRFAERETPQKKTAMEAILELSNLGAFKNDNFKSLVAERMGMPSLSKETLDLIHAQAQYIQELEPESREQKIEIARLHEMIAKNQKKSKLEYIDFTQTLAQLLNPKTIMRNLIGNFGFGAIETLITDNVKVPLDAVVGQFTEQRTAKFMPGEKVKAWAGGFKEGWEKGLYDALNHIDTTENTTRFDFKSTRMYHDGIMGSLETALNISLRATDRAYYKAAVEEALVEMRAIQGGELSQEMIETAHVMGLYRTFQDDTKLAEFLVKTKRHLNLGKGFGVGSMTLKYPKTPANLLMRGLDYSPFGLVMTAVKLHTDVTNNSYLKQKQAVDGFTRSLVGTGILAAGAAMYRLGIISRRKDDDEDWDIYSTKLSSGMREYQINKSLLKRYLFGTGDYETKYGDEMATYDWFQPTAITIGMGADIEANKGLTGFATGFISSFEAGVQSITSQPLLSNFAEAFQKETVGEAATNILQQVPDSFIPTLFSQTQIMLDPTVYQNWVKDDWIKTMVNKASRKIPYLSSKVAEPSITNFGDIAQYYDENDRSWLKRFWDSYFSPAITGTYEPTPNEAMVLEIYENTGETLQAPGGIRWNYKIDVGRDQKAEIKLTEREYRVLSEWTGKNVDREFDKIREAYYGRYDDEIVASELNQAINAVGRQLKDKLYKMYKQKELSNVELIGGE